MKAVIRYEDSKGGIHETEEAALEADKVISEKLEINQFQKEVNKLLGDFPVRKHHIDSDPNELPKRFIGMFTHSGFYVNKGYYKFLFLQIKKLYLLGKKYDLID